MTAKRINKEIESIKKIKESHLNKGYISSRRAKALVRLESLERFWTEQQGNITQ